MGVEFKIEYVCEMCGKHKLDVADSSDIESGCVAITMPYGWIRLDDHIMCEDCADEMTDIFAYVVNKRLAGDQAYIDLWDTITDMVADDE